MTTELKRNPQENQVLRAEMLKRREHYPQQINRDEDCAEASMQLMAMRVVMLGPDRPAQPARRRGAPARCRRAVKLDWPRRQQGTLKGPRGAVCDDRGIENPDPARQLVELASTIREARSIRLSSARAQLLLSRKRRSWRFDQASCPDAVRSAEMVRSNADNPVWINALAEVRMLACPRGLVLQHVQAIIVSIDQYAESRSATRLLPETSRIASAAAGATTFPDRGNHRRQLAPRRFLQAAGSSLESMDANRPAHARSGRDGLVKKIAPAQPEEIVAAAAHWKCGDAAACSGSSRDCRARIRVLVERDDNRLDVLVAPALAAGQHPHLGQSALIQTDYPRWDRTISADLTASGQPRLIKSSSSPACAESRSCALALLRPD